MKGKGDSAVKVNVRVFEIGPGKGTTHGGNRMESLWLRGKGGNHRGKVL